MILSKIKKALSLGLAAVMCAAVLGTSVCAEGSVWKDTKTLIASGYNSDYISLVKKYSGTASAKKIAYSKSKTRQFYEKMAKAQSSKLVQFTESYINENMMISRSVKGDGMKKIVLYMNDYDGGEVGSAIYVANKYITLVYANHKVKLTAPVFAQNANNAGTSPFGDFDIDSFMAEEVGISDNAKGRTITFRSNSRNYCYEEFDRDGSNVGMLFDTSGNPLAMIDGDIAMCYSVSFSVNDAEFTVPTVYTEAESEADLDHIWEAMLFWGDILGFENKIDDEEIVERE